MPAAVAPPSAALARAVALGVALLALLGLAACGEDASPVEACEDGGQTLTMGFYAFFAPVSYSADQDPASAGFDTHLGYESDLVTALEAMDNTGLSFVRRGIAAWDDIWLQSAGPRH